jgi:hypothetical protein
MTPHRIRLHSFWVTTAGCHARRFGRPRTLDAGETAWLVGVGVGTVSLNGEPLGEAAGPFAFEVTAKLLPRNELALAGPAQPEDVALELRPRLSNT